MWKTPGKHKTQVGDRYFEFIDVQAQKKSYFQKQIGETYRYLRAILFFLFHIMVVDCTKPEMCLMIHHKLHHDDTPYCPDQTKPTQGKPNKTKLL